MTGEVKLDLKICITGSRRRIQILYFCLKKRRKKKKRNEENHNFKNTVLNSK